MSKSGTQNLPESTIDFESIHPDAKASDFYANNKLLPDDKIKELLNTFESMSEEKRVNARYSKKYIKDILKIDIGNRGGLVTTWDEKKQKVTLYVTYKTKTINILGRPAFSKAILLGKGHSKKVKLAQDLITGKFAALAVLTSTTPTARANFERGTYFRKKLRRSKGIIFQKMITADEADKGKWYEIQDYFPGKELFVALENSGKAKNEADKLKPEDRFGILLKVFAKIRYLHFIEKVLHRDIKPENIIYHTKTKTVTVIDLDSMQVIGKQDKKPCGTPGFNAPECVNYDYSTASEVYALGRLTQDVFGIEAHTLTNSFGTIDPGGKVGLTPDEFNKIIDISDQMLGFFPEKRISLTDAMKQLEKLIKAYSSRKETKEDEAKAISGSTLKEYTMADIAPPDLLGADTQLKELKKLDNEMKKYIDDLTKRINDNFTDNAEGDDKDLKKSRADFYSNLLDKVTELQAAFKTADNIRHALFIKDLLENSTNSLLNFDKNARDLLAEIDKNKSATENTLLLNAFDEIKKTINHSYIMMSGDSPKEIAQAYINFYETLKKFIAQIPEPEKLSLHAQPNSLHTLIAKINLTLNDADCKKTYISSQEILKTPSVDESKHTPKQ